MIPTSSTSSSESGGEQQEAIEPLPLEQQQQQRHHHHEEPPLPDPVHDNEVVNPATTSNVATSTLPQHHTNASMYLHWGQNAYFTSAPPPPAAAPLPTAAPLPAPQTPSPAQRNSPTSQSHTSSPPQEDVPLPPGHIIELPDPATGQSQQYRVEYNYYSMPRSHVSAFMEAYMTQQQHGHPPSQSTESASPPHMDRAPAAARSGRGGRRRSPTASPFTSSPQSATSSDIAPAPAFRPMNLLPAAPPPVDLPQGWGWSWQNGMWVLWNGDPGSGDANEQTGQGRSG